MLYMEHGVEKVTCVDCGDTQVQTRPRWTKATREAGAGHPGVFRPGMMGCRMGG